MARKSWLDAQTQEVMIDDYAQQLTTFVDAMADGHVDSQEIATQEKRVIELMKQVEPQLDDQLHPLVTKLLCELSAFNIMQLLHTMQEARPKTRFRG